MNNILLAWLGGPELIFLLITGGLWIYCLFDIIGSNFKGSNTKLLWILIVLFAPVLGSLIYLAIGSKQKTIV